jgi:serine protease
MPAAGRPNRVLVIRVLLRRIAPLAAIAVLACSAAPARASAAAASEYAPGEIIVHRNPAAATAVAARAGEEEAGSNTTVHLAPGQSMASALRRLRAERGVAWAVPNYRARIAEAPAYYPDDPGRRGGSPGGWKELQWNFVGEWGVRAPEAWANLIADGRPGGQGVIVALLDTGVAYANHGPFRRSPDFGRDQFVKGYDFIARNGYPEDRNGHGTFVAATIAEETNNGKGLTGLAYGARIMPVRVLNAVGEGEASTIAEGVYYAVRHGAQVINLSLEFSPGVTASDIPELIAALRFAHRRRVLVVAAAGNEGHDAIAYPARAPNVVSVGATTEHGCLADYSNDGSGLTLVAPGGGPDADLPGDPNCHPEDPAGRDIFQVTFTGSSFKKFGIPDGYEGTSMATPHVAATAALIIASRVLGGHPTPAALTARLTATARRLGGGGDEDLYGAGLLDSAAATAPGGPGAVAP